MANYSVPNRAAKYKVVASAPINDNWQYIEDALNELNNKADKVTEKIDKTEKGVAGGVATLDGNGLVPDSQLGKGEPNGVAGLDEDGKVDVEQLPEEIYAQVFEVGSLNEQLALDCYVGDICKRLDTLATYVLKEEPAYDLENWMEISTQGQIVPEYTDDTEPYHFEFLDTDWEDYQVNGRLYRLTILESEHNLGTYDELFAFVKDFNRNAVQCDYDVDDFGTVTLYSSTPFSGSATITNLYGNSDPLNLVAYSVNRAMVREDGVEDLFLETETSLALNTTIPIVLTDGFNTTKIINASLETDLTELMDGVYEIFIDTDCIEKDSHTLEELTFVPKEHYLGIQKRLPKIANEDDRVYVAYDHSYIYTQTGWALKAFTHVGCAVIKTKKLAKLYTKPYNQNGVITNYLSTNKDYLYGGKIENLIIGTSKYSTEITFPPGQCLSYDKQIMFTNTKSVSKNPIKAFGDGNGALLGNLYENSYFLSAFIIGDDYGNIDFCTAAGLVPDLSRTEYNHYRRLCTYPLKDGAVVMGDDDGAGNLRFFEEQILYEGTFTGGANTTFNLTSVIPNLVGTSGIFSYIFETDPGVVKISNDSTLIGYYSGKAATFEVPYGGLFVQPEITTTGKIILIGYTDKRELWIR